MKKLQIKLFIVLIIALFTSCKNFLDEKPNQKLQIPSNLKDLQSILDYYLRVNTYEPSAAEVSADDYYLTDDLWNGVSQESYRNMYLWQDANLFERGYNDWSYGYSNVFRANTILEHIDNVELSSIQDHISRDNIKGQALALRARMFMKFAFIWSPIYSKDDLDNPYGIPLKLSSDFNDKVVRSTVGNTYRQIEEDLLKAVPLLANVQMHPLRTNKAAAYGLLARLYLVMGEYEQAYRYADSCLSIHDKLLSFNDLDSSSRYPFVEYNDEVILGTHMSTPGILSNTRAIIVPELYDTYKDGDLRKTLFFQLSNDGTHRFRGSYNGNTALFDGIATDEILLTKAESLIRLGNVTEGIAVLNTLLSTRWEKESYIPYPSEIANPLDIVLLERRKSLLMRGVRWIDLKRYNRDGANIKIVRSIYDRDYELLPNDPRYALPIPEEVIQISGIDQNPR